ncbi:TlpA family protein disulfide reductase [Methylocaldum szegediense]|uniref:TlpA family protein disulfide reductase n=1 Tax=Methylocaldum szegediense TaxID=73780 RepID=UPI00047E7B40|nr:TlpA disulfide reductase family protein [Methylocaldum szegediense]
MKRHLLSILLLGGSASVHAVQQGMSVPECPAVLPGNSEKLNLGAYQGKVLLIDFWATWCPPCKKSMPFFNGLRNQHLKDGFEVVAINVDENTEDALRYLEAHPVNYVTAFDSSGECPRVFDVKAMPSSYLVDRQGKVRLVHLGYRDEDQDFLRKQVDTLLGE